MNKSIERQKQKYIFVFFSAWCLQNCQLPSSKFQVPTNTRMLRKFDTMHWAVRSALLLIILTWDGFNFLTGEW